MEEEHVKTEELERQWVLIGITLDWKLKTSDMLLKGFAVFQQILFNKPGRSGHPDLDIVSLISQVFHRDKADNGLLVPKDYLTIVFKKNKY